MSRNYEFVAYLNANYCEEKIFSILENGSKFGCIYRDPLHNKVDTLGAMKVIWQQYSQKKPPLIQVEHYEKYYDIWFYNRNNKIYLYIGITYTAWKKRYDLSGSYGINFYRYQHFMLRLIGDNVITHFETYEYFNESYHADDEEHNIKIYVKLYIYWPYDVYHHLKVNGKILGITWLDANKQPINLKSQDNAFEDIFFNEDTSPQCWHAMHHNMVLKFSHPDERTFIIEPISIESSATIDQAQMFDTALRTTIELFKNIHVFRLITFKSDEDIININKMDD